MIGFDSASNSGYQIAASSYTWSHTCSGEARFLPVGVSLLSIAGASVSSITYAGRNLIRARADESASGVIKTQLWYLIAPPLGANDITVTFSTGIDSAAGAVSLVGVNQASPLDGSNGASATNGASPADATVDVTTIADNCWLIDTVATTDTAISIGAGQTQRWNTTGTLGSGGGSTEGPKSPAGAVTMSWTDVAALATWTISALSIKPAPETLLGISTPATYFEQQNRMVGY